MKNWNSIEIENGGLEFNWNWKWKIGIKLKLKLNPHSHFVSLAWKRDASTEGGRAYLGEGSTGSDYLQNCRFILSVLRWWSRGWSLLAEDVDYRGFACFACSWKEGRCCWKHHWNSSVSTVLDFSTWGGIYPINCKASRFQLRHAKVSRYHP